MADDAVLARVRKLLALAASTTFEQEGRTAALAAARLIQQHGLRVVREETPEPAAGRFRRDPEPARRPEPPQFVLVKLSRAVACELCTRPLARGAMAWWCELAFARERCVVCVGCRAPRT